MNQQQAKDLICEAFQLLGSKYSSPEAERMMLVIGFQESNFLHRQQIGGPAKGFWQFEKMGGVLGVLRHHSVRNDAAKICNYLGVLPDPETVYDKLPKDDLLAACFARLLLYTDPNPLPTDELSAWECYIRTWRPGAYLNGFIPTEEQKYPEVSDRWPENWKKSSQ